MQNGDQHCHEVRCMTSLQSKGATVADGVGQTKLPFRSKSHPLRDTRTSGLLDRQAEAFNPDDLCTRLEALRRDLRQQHRRRREDAEKPRRSETYHHVPQVAARDFAKTTTPHKLRDKDIHKLSRSVLKKYKLGSGSKTSTTDEPPKQFSNARESMDVLAERNQFQRTQALESAACADKARSLAMSRPHDIPHLLVSSNPHAGNSRSIGPAEVSELAMWDPDIECCKPLIYRPEDRNDWTQRDDFEEDERHVLKDLVGPFLRRLAKNSTPEETTCDSTVDLSNKQPQGFRASRRRFSFFT